MKNSRGLIDKLFRDKSNKLVIVQFPNIPIIIAFLAWISLHFSTNETMSLVLTLVLNCALIVWAVLEIGWGVNWFRRLLGVVVAGWLIIGFALQYLY